MRRVKRLNPTTTKAKDTTRATTKATESTAEQQELFSLDRYHAVFPDSPVTLVKGARRRTAVTRLSSRLTPT